MTPRATYIITLIAAALAAGAAWAETKPTVIDTVFPTEDIVVASLVVEADAEGSADATGAIQAAIDEAADAGGGVIFLPAGRYLLEGQLLLKEGVTLRGDWAPPTDQDHAAGTVLMPVAGAGDAEGPAAIVMERGTGLREVSIWYPGQDALDITPYPWAIQTSPEVTSDNYTVHNVTLVNPYQGIKVGPHANELHTIRNVYGTPLKTGLWVDSTTDIGRLIEVDFSGRWWVASGYEGAPEAEEARLALREYLLAEACGVDMGRSDWEYIYRVRVTGYGTGLKIRQGERGTTNAVMFGAELTGGRVGLLLERLNGVGLAATGCKLSGTEHGVYGPPTFDTVAQFNSCEIGGGAREAVRLDGPGTLTFQNCRFDAWTETAVNAERGSVTLAGCEFANKGRHIRLGPEVSRARVLGCRFAGGESIVDETQGADVMVSRQAFDFPRPDISPHPAQPDRRPPTRELLTVTGFGASVDADDNTQAFAEALNVAAQAGGGTVYVPAGMYRLKGELTVPTGVELRGIFDVPHHTVSAGSVLLVLGGRGEEDGTPFISMQAESGLRGLTFWYPEQDVSAVEAYPWTVRGMGKGCWLTDVTIGNAYQAVDFATHDTSGHLIRYLAGAMYRRGLFIGNCSGEGWVEDVQFNPHYSLRVPGTLPHPPFVGDAGGTMIDHQRRELEGIVLGSCANEHVARTFLYAAYDGIKLRDDGAGGPNARILMHGTDTASRAAVLEAAGERGVEFTLAQLVPLGKYEVGGLIAPGNSRGRFSFFNSQMWAGNLSGRLEGDAEVLLQQMVTHSGPLELAGASCVVDNVLFARDLSPHITVERPCREARVLACQTVGLLRVENRAGDRALIRMGSLPRRPKGETFVHATSWEPGDAQPLEDAVAEMGGLRKVSGQACKLTDEDARTGEWSLKLSGNADDPEYSYVYFKVLEARLGIMPDAVLRYHIKPLTERGRHIGIDLRFTDGTLLRMSGAQTTEGGGSHPGGQKGPVGEWGEVAIPLGRYFTGKVIDTVMFAYDSRGGGGRFEALIDDLALESPSADVPWEAFATPSGGRHAPGVAVELASVDGLPMRYTLDGTNPTADSPLYEQPIRLDEPGLHEIRFSVEAADGTVSPWPLAAAYDVTP